MNCPDELREARGKVEDAMIALRKALALLEMLEREEAPPPP